MTDYGHIELDIHDGVATIRFIRPETLNAPSLQLLQEPVSSPWPRKHNEGRGTPQTATVINRPSP